MKFIGVVPLAVGQSPPVAKTKAVFSEYRRCPDSWKMAVAAFLDDPEHGRGRRAQLSRDTGVSKSMLTALLKLTTDTPPGPRASKVAKAVADWTGIPLPDEALEDEEIAALVADAVAMQRISPRLLHQAAATFRSVLESVSEKVGNTPGGPGDTPAGGHRGTPKKNRS